MLDETAPLTNNTTLDTPPRPENPNQINLIGVYEPAGQEQLKQKLLDSNGRCLILVHPFYHSPSWGSLQSKQNNPEYDNYLNKLRTLIKKNQQLKNNSLPILLMAEADGPISPFRNEQLNSRASTRTTGQLFELMESGGNYFFILTGSQTPCPIDFPHTNEPERILKRTQLPLYNGMDPGTQSFIDFVLSLKKIGLNQAVIAGCDLTGAHQETAWYRNSSSRPLGQAAFTDINWLLRDHYQARFLARRGRIQHPLEIIAPESCVAAATRAFAFCDVQTDLTQVTHPGILPKYSQLVQKGDTYIIK